MPARRKPAIARAFDGAEDYAAHAHIQRAAALHLAALIAAMPLHRESRILEIGCGTGFLSAELTRTLPGARLVLSDLSESMVGRTRDLIGAGTERHYVVMDGERPCFGVGPQFDLICSSLAFQWFEDLGGAIARLADALRPGGCLAFATLTAGTFAEWRDAHLRTGVDPATRAYPSTTEIEALCPPGCMIRVEPQHLVEHHPDGIAFLRSLKAIGAHTPWRERAPLSAATMRRVLDRFTTSGAAVTYEIAHVVVTKMPEGL